MKNLRKYLSVMLVLAVCLVSLPMTLTSVSADAAETKKVIYQFEPGKTRQSVGQEVSIWDGFTVCPTYVRKDADGYYYSTEIGPYSGQKYMSYDTGWTNETMPLLANNAVMNALTPFIEVSLDVRVVSDNPGFSDNSLKVDVASFDSVTGGNFWHYWGVYAQTDGDWHTYTKTEASNNYSGGSVSKITYIISDVPVNCKVEVRNFKASVNESDATAINAALNGTGYTYESITQYDPFIFNSPIHTILQVTPERTVQNGSVKSSFNESIYTGFLNTVVDEETAGKFYSVDYEDSANGGKSAFINTGWNTKVNAPSWMGNQTLINELIPFLQISVDVRVTGYNEYDEYYPVDNVSFMMHALDFWDADSYFSYWGPDPRTFNLIPGGTTVPADGEWHTITSNAGGSTGGNGIAAFNLALDITNNSNSSILFDFKNLTIGLKECDADDINSRLSSIGSSYTYEQLVDFVSYYNLDTVIWYADAAKANKTVNNNGKVSYDVPNWIPEWQLSKAFDTYYQSNTEDGNYYHAVMQVAGSGGAASNTLVTSGITSQTKGYGWMSSVEVLNALRPYMNVGLQYRATNGGGSNYQIDIRPANSDSYAVQYGQICDYMTQFYTVSLNNWCQKDYSVFAHDFTRAWNDGNFSISIYSYDGKLAGKQDVDIRDLNIAIASDNRERINAALSKVEGIDSITNFTAGIELDTDANGNKDYFSLLSSTSCLVENDVNSDGEFNVLDLIASKKYSVNGFVPKFILNQIDADKNGELAAYDLSALVVSLLNQEIKRNDFVIGLAQDHPGVAEMAADYTLTISDKSGNSLDPSDFNWSANSNAVSFNGSVITVPYGIRMSSRDLVVTATSKTNSSLYGTYTFNFQKFASNPSFADEFDGDSVDTDKWTVTGSASVANGKLSLTPATNNARSGLDTDGKYTQTYGSFNARMKIPTSSASSAFTAFWLMDYGAYYIDPNFPNNTQGEIDIVEYISKYDTYMSSVHWNGYITQDGRPYNGEGVTAGEGDYYMRAYRFTDVTSNNPWYETNDMRIGMNPGLNVEDGQFHDISAVWTKDAIYFYFDGRLISVHTGQGVGQSTASMHMLLDYTGLTSETLLVDSVKVYSLA